MPESFPMTAAMPPAGVSGTEKMKDCVVLTGNVDDANLAATWAASCAERARLTKAEATAIAAHVRNRYAQACTALFGETTGRNRVLLSAEFEKGRPQFEICTDGAVSCEADCEALGPRRDDRACDGLTCYVLPT